MKAKWKIPTALCAVALWLSACSTDAQTKVNPLADVPPPDEMRFITTHDATSKCIGDPKTPLCAVETILACFARHDSDLCLKVGVSGMNFPGETYTSHYRIMSTKILKADHITGRKKDTDWKKNGDIHFIFFEPDGDGGTCQIEHCRFIDNPDGPTGDQCCNNSYVTRLINNEWRVINWWWWGDH